MPSVGKILMLFAAFEEVPWVPMKPLEKETDTVPAKAACGDVAPRTTTARSRLETSPVSLGKQKARIGCLNGNALKNPKAICVICRKMASDTRIMQLLFNGAPNAHDQSID